ncbi:MULTISPECIES: hypothetical protein [unclassified Streptomyces]|uniref:hypothetical protein n=1 Tax=unclassified Streptomyces TaxID=2593676 RepID=UPI0022720C42|nr:MULTISPECIES: hypothetical protein [unclassified Streptomyces]MCY0929429.1 hypothetical protein [Streptomyces sp. H27-H1]MCY0938578.1 hypothetical protein [Streptomyces sp. H34-S4]MDJ0383252.1 hypothetical protein [Streptomyces sp. G-G2]
MFWARGKKSLTAIVGGLHIPEPFDLQDFCDSIANLRGRPLILIPVEAGPATELPCGLWLGLDDADLVFYDASAPDFLRAQIVLHEVSHMLLGHTAPELGDPDLDGAHILGQVVAQLNGPTGDEPAASASEALRSEAARVRASAAEVKVLDSEMGFSPDRIASLLARTGFRSRQERDAETLATLILERASRRPEVKSKSREAGGVVGRLNDAFGHPARRK